MAGSFDNLIRFNATSPGTVDFVVASAPVNCVTPEQAGAIDGKTYRYFARSADGSVWEWGSGAYVYASHTMIRTTISSTSVSSITNGILDKIVFAVAPIVDVFPASVARLEPPGSNYVPWDVPIALTGNQKAQARANIDVLKKNYIINGAMMVSQENGATAGTANAYYPVDQFVMLKFTSGVVSCAQVAAASPAGSPNRLRVTASTADTSIATNEFVTIYQYIEANYTADLLFGSASAKPCTLRFGVKAPAGAYCVTLSNSAQNRAFVAEFTIVAGEANTDVVKSVTIPGDVTGSWGTGNAAGILVSWTLAAGSTFQTTAGAWTSGNKIASASQFNLMGTLGNVFELFDVGLYEGAAAPAFQVPAIGTELAICQRYFVPIPTSFIGGGGTLRTGGTAGYGWFPTPVPMRASPSMSVSGMYLVCGDTVTALSSVTTGQICGTILNINVTPAASAGALGLAFVFFQQTGVNALNARM